MKSGYQDEWKTASPQVCETRFQVAQAEWDALVKASDTHAMAMWLQEHGYRLRDLAAAEAQWWAAVDDPAEGRGCPRCRMDLIRFVREVRLPRFTMAAGDEWNLPQVRYLPDGSAELGQGVAPAGSFEVVTRDATRACHNGTPCPGDGAT